MTGYDVVEQAKLIAGLVNRGKYRRACKVRVWGGKQNKTLKITTAVAERLSQSSVPTFSPENVVADSTVIPCKCSVVI